MPKIKALPACFASACVVTSHGAWHNVGTFLISRTTIKFGAWWSHCCDILLYVKIMKWVMFFIAREHLLNELLLHCACEGLLLSCQWTPLIVIVELPFDSLCLTVDIVRSCPRGSWWLTSIMCNVVHLPVNCHHWILHDFLCNRALKRLWNWY